ncbi:hypothetical protein [Streptomyces sp. NPDC090112]|uniref:hypothetical protein n=1 Tax=Streptomyces sp. NPDC090112 TaxID=3365949 RepID=UPI00382DCC66
MAVRNVSGNWKLEQDNGFTVTMKLEQDPEGQVNASPSGNARVKGDATTPGLDGAVKGFVTATSFRVVVDWDRSGPGRGGEYSGTFQVLNEAGDAQLVGVTFDLDNPNSTANWRSFNHSFGAPS